MPPNASDDTPHVHTRPDIEVVGDARADDRLARARRIRARRQELIDALGPEHPLVEAALRKAEALEWDAAHPGEIRLR